MAGGGNAGCGVRLGEGKQTEPQGKGREVEGLTALSRPAVANKDPSGNHEQSQMIRAWPLSAATGMYPSRENITRY